ncbi:hypothetical protein ER308_07120 [Egibacter rhizosphaerae]|uniref:Uncharacterized protein n=1 Tax=Egibacter rhizosphaerae TaxID=1670831 RepID=A0A411YDX6_9ACTN|nr:hypothetical protein [Egibacter rhizosphaerae]QBI19337.1 hypothetical protein ER308_07120 [Egibacter rhizosphaerae]
MVRPARDDKFEEILHKVRTRRDGDSQRIREMIEVRDRYEGDWSVPIPEVDDEEELDAPVPFLLADAIDQTAMRAASVMPHVEVPKVVGDGVTHETAADWARRRRKNLYSAWDYSALPILMARAFRHYAGYGSMAFAVVPDFEERRSRIVLRDPLSSYPEPRDAEEVRAPRDCAFVYGKTRAELLAQYGDDVRDVLDNYRVNPESQVWDVFEWIDEDEIVLGILGPRQPDWSRTRNFLADKPEVSAPLHRWPNRAGRCTAHVPYRVTLNRVMAQVKNAVPVSDLWAKMMALDVKAAEKTVFQDRYLVGSENEDPQIVSHDGNWQPGHTGRMNRLRGVAQLGVLQDGPGPAAQPVIDRLERGVRANAGALPQFQGETPSSLRTGRALDAMQDMSLDPRIQEMHTVSEYALRTVNEMVFAVDEGYWPRRRHQRFSGWPADRGVFAFEPAKHNQTADGGRNNAVSYAIAGADVTQTTTAIGSMVGANLLDRKTARIKHPMIADHEEAEHQIHLERLEDAFGVSFAQQVAGGEILVQDAVEAIRAMQRGESQVDAVQRAQEAAQEREADQMQQMQDDPQAPQAQPGLQPAAPAEEAMQARQEAAPQLSPVEGPTTGQERLRQLATALRASPS